jgi:3-hydroxybutyryl-CoA dehydrogenase
VVESKRDALEWACRHLRADAIVASTTSTMLSTELAGFVTHPERFLNAHWLNPAYLVPLVELSPHPGTAPAVVERTKALLGAIGKVPVVCAPAPGFIVPRMQALMMNEAARMIEQGVATAEDIDRAVRHGLGFRYASTGVVEFIDVGGLDILYYASRYLAQSTGDRYMHAGRDGLRSGRGFYDWNSVDVPAYRRDALGRQLAMLRQLGMLKPPGSARGS